MNSNLYNLKNLEMGGTLKRKLKSYRKSGKSFREIAKLLSTEGTPVTHETIRGWCVFVGTEKAGVTPPE